MSAKLDRGAIPTTNIPHRTPNAIGILYPVFVVRVIIHVLRGVRTIGNISPLVRIIITTRKYWRTSSAQLSDVTTVTSQHL